ncbi:MAG: response regulator, partial [Bacteroidales bacterium]|nr:response regulator [Bacteroidales bacterium]
MRLKLILVTYLIIAGFVGLTFAQNTTLFYDNYTVIPGQPETPIISVFEDSQGFIWYTSINGLYRYDGYNTVNFTHDPYDTTTISSNLVRSVLFEDDSEGLWLVNFSNLYDRFDKATGKVTRYPTNSDNLGDSIVIGVRQGCQDSAGNILGYGYGGEFVKYYIDEGIVEHRFFTPRYPDSSVNHTYTVYKDSKNVIWIGCGAGILIYDEVNDDFDRFVPSNKEEFRFDTLAVYDILEASDGVFWFGTENGLFKYSPLDEKLIRYEDPSTGSDQYFGKVYEFLPEQGNSLWLRKYNGLSKFDINIETFQFFPFDPDDPRYKYLHLVYAELMDKTGRLWLATDNLGLIRISPAESLFKNYYIRSNIDDYLYAGASFYKDSDNILWVGTGYGGLFKLDSNMSLLENYRHDPDNENSLNYLFPYSLFKDEEGILWVGFAGYGLGKLDTRTNEYERILDYDDIENGFALRIYEIFQDRQDIIWFLSTQGLYYIDKGIAGARVEKFPGQEEGNIIAMSYYEDSAGDIWFACPGNGIYCLTLKNRADTTFIHFLNDPNNQESLPTDQVSSVCEDKEGNYWIGTEVGLVNFFPEDSSFKLFDHKSRPDYLSPSNIKRDPSDNLWFICEKGLVQFNPFAPEDQVFSPITIHDGMPFKSIYPWKYYIDNDGFIYCGGRRGSGNGFFTFDPCNLHENKHIPTVILSSFKVRNEDFSMDSIITAIKHIDLKYHQNYFSFEFAALDYVNPERNQYAYMLEGVDEDWIYSGNRRFANYTGVPPGDYVFRVKGSNNDGYWNEEGTSVRLIISPPLWATWYAYLFYGIIILLLLYFLRRYDLKRQRLKKNLEIEQVEAKKLKELDKLKSQFFANISHEFRTPLTLILGPLEKFQKKISDPESEQDLNIMQRNALRLQKLINQLLSLSKIESGQMKLQAWEEDIVSLTKGYVQSFESLAQQQNIQLTYNSDIAFLPLYIDRDKIEKILYNLLSNALKFTGNRGKVDVSLGEAEDFVSLRISDTGAGISEDDLEHIFDRFYRAENSNYQEGTGIGLALAKELVELHHGKIEVESELGTGTTFTVFLPKGKEHLQEDELVKNPEDMISPFQFTLRDEGEFNKDVEDRESASQSIDLLKEDSDPVLLIVEDNEDLRRYIGSYFENEYQLIGAVDGVEGFEKAVENLPDIIISDVMMPNMDGFELGQKLKNDQRTSHIPL